jgi:hypothetical protein
MTKNEAAIAALAIMFGSFIDRELYNFDRKAFVLKAAQQWDLSDASLKRAARCVKQFAKKVEPSWFSER